MRIFKKWTMKCTNYTNIIFYYKTIYSIQRKVSFHTSFIKPPTIFIYNYLKRNDPGFQSEFGNRLEKYVELGIKEMELTYQRETDLKIPFPKSKVCDFAIKTKVLVEVKATELSIRSGVTRSQDVMLTETTIVKAYSQLIELANRMDPNGTFYGIIITYKDMFLGFGRDAWKEFLKEKITALCLQKGFNLSAVPPDNLFFLSIDDWDKMVQLVKNKTVTIDEILQCAYYQSVESDITEKIMFFNQVFNRYPIKEFTLSYLNGLINKLRLQKSDG